MGQRIGPDSSLQLYSLLAQASQRSCDERSSLAAIRALYNQGGLQSHTLRDQFTQAKPTMALQSVSYGSRSAQNKDLIGALVTDAQAENIAEAKAAAALACDDQLTKLATKVYNLAHLSDNGVTYDHVEIEGTLGDETSYTLVFSRNAGGVAPARVNLQALSTRTGANVASLLTQAGDVANYIEILFRLEADLARDWEVVISRHNLSVDDNAYYDSVSPPNEDADYYDASKKPLPPPPEGIEPCDSGRFVYTDLDAPTSHDIERGEQMFQDYSKGLVRYEVHEQADPYEEWYFESDDTDDSIHRPAPDPYDSPAPSPPPQDEMQGEEVQVPVSTPFTASTRPPRMKMFNLTNGLRNYWHDLLKMGDLDWVSTSDTLTFFSTSKEQRIMFKMEKSVQDAKSVVWVERNPPKDRTPIVVKTPLDLTLNKPSFESLRGLADQAARVLESKPA